MNTETDNRSIRQYCTMNVSSAGGASEVELKQEFCNRHNQQYYRLQTFNGPFSGTTRVRRYQKGKSTLDFTEARDSEWQWHQLGHMQVCTSLQTDNHTSTQPLSFYRLDALPANQQHRNTEGRTNKPTVTTINCYTVTRYGDMQVTPIRRTLVSHP